MAESASVPIAGRGQPGTSPTGSATTRTPAEGIPSGRYSSPEEIAAVVAFLACEDARHIHGAFLIVDGGQTAV